MVPLALEIQHGVDDVLQRLRAGEIAVLRDVADQHDGDIFPLGCEQQMRGHFAHLSDAAGGRLEPRGKDRLDGIHDDQRRLQSLDLFENALQTGFRQQVQRRAIDGQPFAAQFDLMLRFLT